MGSTYNVSDHDLIEWRKQDNTLADWNRLFFRANIANSENLGDPKEIKLIEEFRLKASTHRTPAKNPKIQLVPSCCKPKTTESSRKG